MKSKANSNSAGTLLLALALILMILPATLAAQNVGFVEHLLSPYGGPNQITTGPDGALWSSGLSIGRTTTAGVTTYYGTPTNTESLGITAGPDGALWFTEEAGNIGRITTGGIVSEYPVPTANSEPQGIIAGPDGALWFTEIFGNAIGRITTAGVITTYPLPTPGSEPWYITAGPDGALWFAEFLSNKIGRITTTGAITEYPLGAVVNPQGIAAGSDGALWFTGLYGTVGRITTAGVSTEYLVSAHAEVLQITAGPDGELWFVDESNSSIGRITTAGVITEYPTPTRNSNLFGITQGPDGALWFTELSTINVNKIGQAVLQTAALSATPDTGKPGTEVTLSGSGFSPNETVNLYSNSTIANPLGTAFADSSGAFTISNSAQQNPYGPNSVTGVGQTSNKIGVAPFTIQAHLYVSPTTAAPGNTITVTGAGFEANFGSFIYSGLGSGRILIGIQETNAVGTFGEGTALTFTIPAGTPPGPFDITARAFPEVFVGAVVNVQ